MKNYSIFQFILILTPFVFSFALGLDIYIPIVPQMTTIFATSPAMVQLTLSLFLFVTGVGQLFIGPLSDQFGRKKIFYISSLCYLIGALGCAFSSHIVELMIARVISSIGACGMLVTSFAVVRDLYSGEESAKMFGFLNGAIGISPTFAPILGGYLATFFGWQTIFLFLALIGLVSLLITKKCIQETHPSEKRVKVEFSVFKRYKTIFSHPVFYSAACLAGLSEGVFFGFFSVSPFIIIELLHVPTHQFGYYFALFGLVISLGGIASGKVVEAIGILSTIFIGIGLMFFGGFSMLFWHYLYDLTLAGFLIPMTFACTGAMFVLGGAASKALEPFPETPGTAAAAFGAMEFGISALIGSLLMMFPVVSTIPYAFMILSISLLSIFVFKKTKELVENPIKFI